MSWLVSSIANSLKLDDDEDDATHAGTIATSTSSPGDEESSANQGQDLIRQIDSPTSSSPRDSQTTPRRGVKDDLSEISKTLTRQFWGVASFLAPPPIPDSDLDPSLLQHASDQSDESDLDSGELAGIAGIRNDLSEIGGKFKTGISKLSSNKAVAEFTKIASNFLQFASEGGETLEDYAQRGVIGVTEEVVSFARDIAMHPETWLDFPLPDDEDEQDFDMSDAQQEHAMAVERLAPSLAALRMELCPGYMGEGSFWKIYFVLVHPRLNKHDAVLLSTPQIMEARAMLTHELQNRAKPKSANSGLADTVDTTMETHEHNERSESVPIEMSALELDTLPEASYVEVDKHPVMNTEIPIRVDKTVVEEASIRKTSDEMPTSSSSKDLEAKYEDDGDDWLKEETSEIGGISGTTIALDNEEDVSFSDLEDDDEDAPLNYKQ